MKFQNFKMKKYAKQLATKGSRTHGESSPDKKKESRTEIQGKYWCYTNHDYNCIPQDLFENSKEYEDKVDYHVYQVEECPDTAKYHLQGYIAFKSNQRFKKLSRSMPGAHWELRKGSHAQARDYCIKEESRVTDCIPYLYGDELSDAQGNRTDLWEIHGEIRDGRGEQYIMENHFGSWTRYHKSFLRAISMYQEKRNWKPTVEVYYGDSGSGKSRKANEENPGAYWKPPDTKWFDGYSGQDVVILDDFRGTWFNDSYLLRLLDRYPMDVENKGSHVPFIPKKIIITSNIHPKDWYGFTGDWDSSPLKRRLDVILEMKK